MKLKVQYYSIVQYKWSMNTCMQRILCLLFTVAVAHSLRLFRDILLYDCYIFEQLEPFDVFLSCLYILELWAHKKNSREMSYWPLELSYTLLFQGNAKPKPVASHWKPAQTVKRQPVVAYCQWGTKSFVAFVAISSRLVWFIPAYHYSIKALTH